MSFELACAMNDVGLLQRMLDDKAIPLCPEKAMYKACSSGSYEALLTLVNFGFVPDLACLSYATANGHARIVRLLVTLGVDINARLSGYYHDSSAIGLAANKGFIDVLDCLIELGADVNQSDTIKVTVLMRACSRNQVDVVDRLLRAGADVNIKDRWGKTSLFYTRTVAIIDRLVVHGADYHHISDRGDSLLVHHVGIINISLEVINRLISLGCDLNIQGKSDGCTALMKACINGKLDVVQALVASGADLNIKSLFGHTALSYARKWSYDNIVKLLLEIGAM